MYMQCPSQHHWPSSPVIYNARPKQQKPLPFMTSVVFLEAFLHHDSRLHPAGDAGGAAFQIHPFHPRPALPALADQIAKISPSDLALLPNRSRLFSCLAELLDTGLQTGSQGLGRVAEDLAHFRRDAGAVGVGVVDRREGVSDSSRESGGKRLGNRGEEIACCQENCVDQVSRPVFSKRTGQQSQREFPTYW